MKAGWKVKPLGEVLDIQNGFAFSSSDFVAESGVPLIRIRDLKRGTGTEVGFVGKYDPAFLVNAGDFLIGMDGEFRCYEWKGTPALLNQRVCRLVSFSSNVVPRFLYYGINKYLREIEDATSFTTVKHLSSKTIKSIQFPLPPLEEQHQIVAVLDEAFEGLARARAHAEANLRDARELFDAVKREVLHPKDSKPLSLSSLVDVQSGFAFKSTEYTESGHFLIRIGNVQDRALDLSNPKFVALDKKTQKFSLNAGDFLTSLTGNIGRVARVETEHLPAALNQRVARITAKPNAALVPEYLYYFLTSPLF